MSGFDRLARPYRWMEYLSFGRALERCRFSFLPQLADTRNALLLGDGDGRFAEQLLRAVKKVEAAHVTAIDGSEAMLALLRMRCAFATDSLTTHAADLSQGLPVNPTGQPYDLVTTHFFLDCLSTQQVERLVEDVKPRMTPNAGWVVSEFAVPARGAMRLPAWIVVRGLYLGFRLLTGLRAQQLPQYREAMRSHGLTLVEERTTLGGLLSAQMWHCG